VQVSMTWALTCPETVHQRPFVTREIETYEAVVHSCFQCFDAVGLYRVDAALCLHDTTSCTTGRTAV